MLIFDAHLDLAMNAVEYNRDLTRPIEEIREREAHMTDKPDRGNGVVSFEEMRRGGIGLCVATQIARYVAPGNPLPGWRSPEIAWSITQAQLAWYREMQRIGELVQLVDREGLDRHVDLWQGEPPADAPIGFILSLEGADSLVTLKHLERAYQDGLRAIGPAHYGPGRYAPGTNNEGQLEPNGPALLREMEQLGMILDCTHLTDEAFWHSLEIFSGPVWASHSNCRAIVPHQRQFNDEQIKALLERHAVIGAAMDAWMLYPPGWVRGRSLPEETGVRIQSAADHIDHICQLAGSAAHCGVGSDLDGGFGCEQCPSDLRTIADLQSLAAILAGRGYSGQDIEGIMHGNWIRFLKEAWS